MTLETDGKYFQIYDFRMLTYGSVNNTSNRYHLESLDCSFKCTNSLLQSLLQSDHKKMIIIWNGLSKMILYGCYAKNYSINNSMIIDICISVDYLEDYILYKNELREKKLKRILGDEIQSR